MPVSLDCPFLVASSVFSNVYLIKISGTRFTKSDDENGNNISADLLEDTIEND